MRDQIATKKQSSLREKKLSITDLFTDSNAILKLLSVDFYGKVKVDSNSSSKTV